MADTGTLATAATASGPATGFPRGKGVYTFALDGDFTGGGSGFLQMLGPGGSTWITIANTTLAVAGAVNVEIPYGRYRLGISGTVVGLNATLKEAGWKSAE